MARGSTSAGVVTDAKLRFVRFALGAARIAIAIMLIGEAVLRRVEQGEWDADDFRGMMDTALSHREDRELFDLD